MSLLKRKILFHNNIRCNRSWRSCFNIYLNNRNISLSKNWCITSCRINNRWCSNLWIINKYSRRKEKKRKPTTMNKSHNWISFSIFSETSFQICSPNQTIWGRRRDWHFRQRGRSFSSISGPFSFGDLDKDILDFNSR